MGQIVKRKKKGRPSKADLARRTSAEPARDTELRRSLRRRNVRYNFDYEDYLDDDFDDDDEDERRREKKLKLVLKLNQAAARDGSDTQDSGASEEDDEDKPSKKRRIVGDDEEEEEERGGNDDEEERGRKADSKGPDSVPGTPGNAQPGLPLPDKKTLELVLDKLQKKDTYGVYAEPVDPEELPDYHDVIEHPMDFATVRNKLASGSYATMDQFESDVFLICSNAMQYNAPETIYHKQARAIQELAKKKFQKLRQDIERSEKEKEVKSEQKIKPNSLAKKQIKKPVCRTSQEPLGSDFSSGATLATASDIQNGTNPTQPGGGERPSNFYVHAEGTETNPEKVEELSSGKGFLSKLGRRSSVLDENRRATYSISAQPVVRSESIFSTFEGEIKQLVAVGLHAEYSYARSLARFAATLGPVAWKVASQKIEQALPAGCKFGRGWVGEYEPLPTSVLLHENLRHREYPFVAKSQYDADLRKNQFQPQEHSVSGSTTGAKAPFFCPSSGPTSERKPSLFSSVGTASMNHQQQTPPSKSSAEPRSKVSKQVELNSTPSASQSNTVLVSDKQTSNNSELTASGSGEMVPRNLTLQRPIPFKHPDTKGVIGGLPNGSAMGNYLSSRIVSPSSDGLPNQMMRAATQFSQGQQQGLSDPVQLMRLLAEKAQRQQKPSDQSTVDVPPAMPSVPSLRKDDLNNAAAAAARAWMSIGAGGFKQTSEPIAHKNQISADSLYNPAREFHSQNSRVRGDIPDSRGIQFQSEKNGFPVQTFVPQAVRMGNEVQLHGRPMAFPQVVTTDLSRFQVQSSWRGLSPHTQPKQKPETLPPDLNIGFQSPGSPARQSSSVQIDSQQPDLALQL